MRVLLGSKSIKIHQLVALFLLAFFARENSRADDLESTRLAIKSNRLKLTSGQVHVVSKEIAMNQKDDKKITEEYNCLITFKEGDKMRFDKVGSSFLIPKRTVADGGNQSAIKKVDNFHWKYFKNGLKCAIFHDNLNLVVVNDTGECKSNTAGYFDIRSIGLYNTAKFLRGYNLGPDFDQLFQYPSKDLKTVEKKSDGVWIFTFEYRSEGLKADIRRVVQVNTKEGFTPVLIELQVKNQLGQYVVQESSTTAWAEENRVWVPTQTSIKSSKGRQEIRLNFEWISINSEVDEKYFSVEDFQIPKDVGIVQMTKGRPIFQQFAEIPKKEMAK